jgi:predicted nucleic acid-binding protein
MVLLALIDEDDGLYKNARHLVNGKENARYAVSLVAIGEVVSKLSETRKRDRSINAIDEMVKILSKERVIVKGFGGDNSCFSLSVTLMNLDPMLKPADGLILATMLSDESSKGLYSTDRIFTFNRVLREFVTSRKRWVRIPPGF